MTAKFEDSRTYAASKTLIFSACMDAMQASGLLVTSSDPTSGSISATSSDSQFSSRLDSGPLEETGLILAHFAGVPSKFKEHVSIKVGNDGTVHALSVSAPRTVILDQGRNRMHILALWKALDEILHHDEHLAEVISFLTKTLTGIDQLDLDRAESAQLQAELAAIREQAESPNPKRHIIRQGLHSIRAILENAGGGAVAVGLLDLLHHLNV